MYNVEYNDINIIAYLPTISVILCRPVAYRVCVVIKQPWFLGDLSCALTFRHFAPRYLQKEIDVPVRGLYPREIWKIDPHETFRF